MHQTFVKAYVYTCVYQGDSLPHFVLIRSSNTLSIQSNWALSKQTISYKLLQIACLVHSSYICHKTLTLLWHQVLTVLPDVCISLEFCRIYLLWNVIFLFLQVVSLTTTSILTDCEKNWAQISYTLYKFPFYVSSIIYFMCSNACQNIWMSFRADSLQIS